MKVVIVGGGIIGLTTALELRNRNIDVVLLESARPGRGASGAAAGILGPLQPWQCKPATTDLLMLSWQRWDALFKQLEPLQQALPSGDTVPLLTHHGVLYLKREQCVAAERWALNHHFDFEHFDQEALHCLAPSLRATGGCVLKNMKRIEVSVLLELLVGAAWAQGVEINAATTVQSLIITAGRVEAVQCNNGNIDADCVVLCAGAWTQALCPDLPTDFIHPVRGQIIEYDYPANALPFVVVVGGRYLIACNGRLLVGSTLEHCGFDDIVTADARETLRTYAAELLPAVCDAPVRRHWSGLRAGVARDTPLIGPYPGIDGLFVNTGHFRNGISLAAGSAVLVAQSICNEGPALDMAAYGL